MTSSTRKAPPLLLAAAWSLVSFLVYMSTGQVSGSGDAAPASLIPVTVLLDGTVMLDRFAEEERRRFPHEYWLADTPHGVASVYPITTGILAVPIYAIPVLIEQLRNAPTTDQWRDLACGPLTKFAAALFVAVAVGVFWSVCTALAFPPWLAAVLTALFAFGSQAMSTSSEGLLQHGPGSLALVCAVRAYIALGTRPRTAAILLSLFAALMVAIRLNNAVLAAPLMLAALLEHPRLWLRLCLPGLAVIAPVLAYNALVFGTPYGGYQSMAAGVALHNAREGLPGTLFSPSRGLVWYFPAALLAAILFLANSRLWRNPLVLALAAGITLQTVLNASYADWPGGHSNGPRYFSEAEPAMLLVLGIALTQIRRLHGLASACLVAMLPWSIFIQSMLTFSNTTRLWNAHPENPPYTERLWDWHDNPISRGVRANLPGSGL